MRDPHGSVLTATECRLRKLAEHPLSAPTTDMGYLADKPRARQDDLVLTSIILVWNRRDSMRRLWCRYLIYAFVTANPRDGAPHVRRSISSFCPPTRL